MLKQEKRIAKFFRYFEVDEEFQNNFIDTQYSMTLLRTQLNNKYTDLKFSFTEIDNMLTGYRKNLANEDRDFYKLGYRMRQFLECKKEYDLVYEKLIAEAESGFSKSDLKKIFDSWNNSNFYLDFSNIYYNFTSKKIEISQINPIHYGFGSTMNGYFSNAFEEYPNNNQEIDRMGCILGCKSAQKVKSFQ